MKRLFAIVALLVVASLLATGCGPKAPKEITVSSKNFTEQYLLGWITVLALEDADFKVNNQVDLGGTVVNREALEKGEVDIYWEYTGTAWLVHLGHEEALTDPEECYSKVKDEDAAKDLIWLDYAPFNDTYTVMMTKAEGDELGISSLSNLATYINEHPDVKMTFGTDEEFTVRPDGLPALQELYGFEFADVIPMEIGVTYKALRDGEVDSAMGFATDGRIGAWGFFNLEDDKAFFPVYNPAPVVRKEVLDKYSELKDILNPIAKKLTTEKMIELNALVDVGPDKELDTGDEMESEDVARDFLKEIGVLE